MAIKQKEPKTCWEFLDCPMDKRKNCNVFKYNYGDKCWILVEDVIKGCDPSVSNCFECSWFKHNNS